MDVNVQTSETSQLSSLRLGDLPRSRSHMLSLLTGEHSFSCVLGVCEGPIVVLPRLSQHTARCASKHWAHHLSERMSLAGKRRNKVSGIPSIECPWRPKMIWPHMQKHTSLCDQMLLGLKRPSSVQVLSIKRDLAGSRC